VSPDLSNVAVVIPALNEEECLPHVLEAIPPVGAVFVVDNGSTDATPSVAAQHGAEVLHQPNRGYGNACQVGIAEAHRRGLSVVVILDGDHSFDPTEMTALVGPIESGEADMVLGDRTETAEPGALLPQQRFGNVVATTLIRTITGHHYRDMGPFRAIRTQVLVDMELEDPNYGWNVEMQMKAVRMGFRVLEVPVCCRNRIAGTSKVSGSFRGAIRCGAKMMLATWRYAR
jgi:glycosyltransferase involved in cell wall biosynthesis